MSDIFPGLSTCTAKFYQYETSFFPVVRNLHSTNFSRNSLIFRSFSQETLNTLSLVKDSGSKKYKKNHRMYTGHKKGMNFISHFVFPIFAMYIPLLLAANSALFVDWGFAVCTTKGKMREMKERVEWGKKDLKFMRFFCTWLFYSLCCRAYTWKELCSHKFSLTIDFRAAAAVFNVLSAKIPILIFYAF